MAGAGDEASPRPNFDRSPAKRKISDTVSDNEALGSQPLGPAPDAEQNAQTKFKKKINLHLTRIRVARQTAFPASQCCGWSGKWDAVVVLHKAKIMTTSCVTNKPISVDFMSNTSAYQTGTSPHQWYPGLQHLQVIVAINLRLQDIRGL